MRRQRHNLIGTAVAAALMKASPMFGESVNLIDKTYERMERQLKRAKKFQLYSKRVSKKPQPIKYPPGYQFPEYLKLEARNTASGKWATR